MLTEREIYVLGEDVVESHRSEYLRCMGSDVIKHTPKKFIQFLDDMILEIERVKSFAIEYDNYCNGVDDEDEEDDY